MMSIEKCQTSCVEMMTDADSYIWFLVYHFFTDCFLYNFQRSGYEVYILEATYKDPAVS